MGAEEVWILGVAVVLWAGGHVDLGALGALGALADEAAVAVDKKGNLTPQLVDTNNTKGTWDSLLRKFIWLRKVKQTLGDFDIYIAADEIPLPGEIQKSQTTQTLTEPQAANTIKYLEKRVGTKKNRFQTVMNMTVS